MITQSIRHTYHRYRTLQTHVISALPVAILMPHSACNCRCVMCDIWKDNKNLRQLTTDDVRELTESFRKLGTKQVVMSGGEALLNPNFFELCRVIKTQRIHITLLSTGLSLKRNMDLLLQWVDDIIVSLDGDEATHDAIRNVDGAFHKVSEAVRAIKSIRPSYPITSRTVIHRLNFRVWNRIIECAKEMGIDRVSFLPADVRSGAFNREQRWDEHRQADVALSVEELPKLKAVLDDLFNRYHADFESGFIAETPAKLSKIYSYYAALHGLNPFPYKKCNAPWVSTVIEPDGSVRPCFFHEPIGNFRGKDLSQVLNSSAAIQFRKHLKMEENETCRSCVCYLNLPPQLNPVK